MSQREKSIYELLFMAAVSLFAIGVLNEARLLLRDVRADLNRTSSEFQATLETVNAAAKQAEQASTQANLAAAEQRAYWGKTSLETYKTMASLRLTIVRTDKNVNEVVVPKIAESLSASVDLQRTAAADLTSTTAKIDDTVEALRPMIESGTKATEAAATAMSDPAIHDTLAEMQDAAKNLDGMSADGKQITADSAAFVHRELAPIHGTWHVIKSILMELIAPSAQVATAIK